jgi:hypothetical protein
MARKQQAEQWAEHRRQCEEEERQSRVMVITEFDAGDPEATLHALADEILKYRRAVRLLAKAIGWAGAGAPFAIIAPVVIGIRGRELLGRAIIAPAPGRGVASKALPPARTLATAPTRWGCRQCFGLARASSLSVRWSSLYQRRVRPTRR